MEQTEATTAPLAAAWPPQLTSSGRRSSAAATKPNVAKKRRATAEGADGSGNESVGGSGSESVGTSVGRSVGSAPGGSESEGGGESGCLCPHCMNAGPEAVADELDDSRTRKRRRAKDGAGRKEHRLGKWWRGYGYDGDAYCQRCSEVRCPRLQLGAPARACWLELAPLT